MKHPARFGRSISACVLSAVLMINPAFAGPRPISIRDWDATAKPAASKKAPAAKAETKEAPQEPATSPDVKAIAEANEAQMEADAIAETFDTPIVEEASDPGVIEAAPPAPLPEIPVDAADADAPIAEAVAAEAAPPVTIDDVDSMAMLRTPSTDEFPLIEDITEENVVLYTQLELKDEPIQGGVIRTPEVTIDMNTRSVDELFNALQHLDQRQEMRVSLDDCLRIMLDANLDIEVAEFDAQRADGELMQARGEFDPTIEASSQFQDSTISPSAQTNAFTGGSLGGGGGGGLGGLLSGGGGGGGLGGLGSGFDASDGIQVGEVLSLLVNAASTAVRLGIQLIPQPPADPFVIEQEGWQHSVSIGGKLHYGTQYELRLNMNVENSTYSGFQDEWDGGLTLTLTQPLLRGRGKNANMARIRTAKNNRISSERQLEQTIMNTTSELVKAYWDLVGAYEQMRVSQRSLANAQRLLSDNQQRLEIGTGNQLEVTQAEASVAGRMSEVAQQRGQIFIQEQRLKQLMTMREETVISPMRIVPIDQIPDARELDIDIQTSVARAMDRKPDLDSARIEVENADIEVKRASNDLLPQLDLRGSYFTGGRGQKTDDIFDGISDQSDETWTASANLSIPITNRQARGAHTSAVVSKRQASRRLTKSENDAIFAVNQAVTNIFTNRFVVESRKEERRFQEINVEKQETSLQLGATTSFEVLRTQEDLANAEAQEVQARIELEKSMVDLELAEGSILENHGIEFEAPETAEAVSFPRSLVPPAPRVD